MEILANVVGVLLVFWTFVVISLFVYVGYQIHKDNKRLNRKQNLATQIAEEEECDYPMVDAINVSWDVDINNVSVGLFVNGGWKEVATVNVSARDKVLEQGAHHQATTLAIDTIMRMPKPMILS